MGKPHLTAEQRALALRLYAKGLNYKEIGSEIDSSLQTAWNVVNRKPTRVVVPFT
jgi:DNA-directed RNA polymerase specialized sigma24 family protein